MIEENVRRLLAELDKGNCFGEPVALVAATKTRTAEEIARAVAAGVRAVGENKVQEYTLKYPDFCRLPAKKHFIGHLQTNKVKYLIGKTDLIQSVSSYRLAEEIAAQSVRAGATTDILLQINIGREESKSGFDPSETQEALGRVSRLDGVRVRGLMAMFPLAARPDSLRALARRMRAMYDEGKETFDLSVLSMGMSADWKIAVECGSNAVRIGSGIFGARDYGQTGGTHGNV